MRRSDIARRIAKLEGIAPKPGGTDWTTIMECAKMQPIHSPFWDTPEGQRIHREAFCPSLKESGPNLRWEAA
jgi:hypothetical protein